MVAVGPSSAAAANVTAVLIKWCREMLTECGRYITVNEIANSNAFHNHGR